MTGSDWFLKKANPQGYRVDIAHPELAKIYADYKKRHGIAFCDPMSAAERMDFEKEIFTLCFNINRKEINNTMKGEGT